MLKKKKCYSLLYSFFNFLFFVAVVVVFVVVVVLGGLCHVVVLFTSKSTSEGQTLAKESTIYLVQLSVGERNFLLKENFH